jgi:hypothetical protein
MSRSSFRQPTYLSSDDEPRHRIRCPVHGFIRFSENERKIIDHRIFRRLRDIRQLALTEMVYPGAAHTRFEHSLGVMELATRAFDQLAATRGNLLEANLQKVAELSKQPLAIARQIVRLAGLLHDVGHVCFSHAAESVIHSGGSHESLTFKLVGDTEYLGEQLDRVYFAGVATLLGKVLHGGAVLPPQLKVLRDLISGEMDADRSDYLLRDSHHCGVEYGRFDQRRMIQCLDLHESDGGALEVGLQRDGIHTFEALILARYQMNTQVYFHRIRRIYDYYLCRTSPKKANPTSIRWKSSWPSPTLGRWRQSCLMPKPATVPRRSGRHAFDRRHHRVVHETGEDAGAMDLKHSGRLLQKLQEQSPRSISCSTWPGHRSTSCSCRRTRSQPGSCLCR